MTMTIVTCRCCYIFLITICFNNVNVIVSSYTRIPITTCRHIISKFASSSSLSSTSSPSLEFELKQSISSIPAQSWNSCVDNNSPFLEHAWLACLEESGCASSSTGWMPSHLEIKMNGTPCAYVPLYIKNNSMGEFIFDAEWAQYAMKMQIKYYPKVLCAIPFTPVSCPKILMSPGLRYQLNNNNKSSSNSITNIGSMGRDSGNDKQIVESGEREFRTIVAKVIKNIATSNNLSSVHMNFITGEEAFDIAGSLPVPKYSNKGRQEGNEEGVNGEKNKGGSESGTSSGLDRVKNVINRFVQRDKNDFFRRTNIQYHWQNRNRNNNDLPYESFEEYLSCFKSKKRITIKRERRRVLEEQNIRIDAIVGADIRNHPGLVERMFEIYKSTVDKMFFGKQYLTLEFFQKLVESEFVDNLLFMCARRKNTYSDDEERFNAEDVFAGTFNVIKNKVFYGRYWGCLQNFDCRDLHFEVCYWNAIEYCIKNKYERFEPGAGGGDYKWARGFDPVLIHSAHYIAQPSFRKAVRDYVLFDSERNVAISELLNERSAVVKQSPQTQDDEYDS